MGLFSSVLRRKRGVIFFVAAFMLPLVFVVAVSIDTFSKRQKTTRNLLESNLWLSGRAAMDKFVAQFNEVEKGRLNPEYFSKLFRSDSLKQLPASPDLFIIDQDFQIVYPANAEENSQYSSDNKKSWSFSYTKNMSLAEAEELSSRNYEDATRYYQASLELAETPQQEALAIEGLARSHLAEQNYQLAIRYYRQLKNTYSKIGNLAGHPYGISAPLQLFSIWTLLGREVFGPDSLQTTYHKIRDGNWLISASSYLFFKAEYESILKMDIPSELSRFEKNQNFKHFLMSYVIPDMKERSGYSEFNRSNETKRIYIQNKHTQYLVSFSEMLLPETERLYFGGNCWNLDTVIARIVPPLLANLAEETGLEFLLVDGNAINLTTSEAAHIPEKSISLSFNKIPFPWTLIAIQPGYEKLESDVRIQLVIYGFLVVFIIILMFFGVFVLLRDINRETESTRLQTEFVHNISHELKTPLSLIRLYGETLLFKDQLPDAARKEGLQIICKESERLTYLINNILDFSKIEMGRKEFDLKPGNLAEVLINTLDSYRYHLVKKGFAIEVEIDRDIPLLMFDKTAVEGILINLFSNALKFSDQSKYLLLRLEDTPDAILLVVADKGIGIPADELTHIFKRFYRVRNTSELETSGSGLGLTLVKHALDEHGWQIKVESTPGQGSVFTIKIPHHAKKEG